MKTGCPYVTLKASIKWRVSILQAFLDIEFWNNTVLDYLIFLGSLAVTLIIILIFKRIVIRWLKKWSQKTPTSLDDMLLKALKRYLLPLLYIGAL